VNVRELIAEAWAAVEEAGVPQHLHEAAFRAAVDFLVGGEAPEDPQGGAAAKGKQARKRRRPDQGRAGDEAGGDDGEGNVDVDEDAFFEKLAQHTSLPLHDLRDVYEFSSGRLRISLPGSRLGGSKKVRVERLAYLLAGGHLLGLGQKSVPTSVVRAEAQRMGALDGNYSSYIRELKQHILYTRPEKQKVLELKPQGEAQYELVLRELTGNPLPE
jgi:hypothetical protein